MVEIKKPPIDVSTSESDIKILGEYLSASMPPKKYEIIAVKPYTAYTSPRLVLLILNTSRYVGRKKRAK